MRIWDIHPGYLNRQSLLGEHRELHGIVSIFRNKKKGYSRHPETLRWVGYGWALHMRHRLLAAEMHLRGYVDRTPVRLRSKKNLWPEEFVDTPAEQFSILGKKYTNIEQGRIPLPRNVQQLWAQHKYSVMARDITAYKRIGSWLAKEGGNAVFVSLAQELTALLRQPPRSGNLKNTLRHMWGYVSQYAEISGEIVGGISPARLLTMLQKLVYEHNVTYLLHSTALSELSAWPGWTQNTKA